MADDLDKRKAELAGLTEQERAELAQFLLDSLDPPVDSDPEAAWDTELARRADEIQRGTAVGKPGDQVFAELRMRMDEEQIRLGSSFEFWKLIEESRRQKTISCEELERRLDQSP
jgi:putative addiction module component (TIGR02574 family)